MSAELQSSLAKAVNFPVDAHITTPLDRCLQLLEKLLGCGQALRSAIAEAVRTAGLSESEFRLLWLCGRADAAGVHQTELCQRLAVSPAHVSGLVEQLRRRELLVGRRAPADRRRQYWRLTAKGRAVLASLAVELSPRAQEWLDHVATEQLRPVTAALGSTDAADRTNDAPAVQRGAA